MTGPAIWRLGEAAPQGPHLAVVPGAQAALLPLDLPDGLRGLARERVAARQLVELLGLPADRFEMRVFAPRGGAWSSALVVDADEAARWRGALKPGCLGLVPDWLALPAADGLWVVETVEDGVAVRLGPGDGFGAEPELALVQLQGEEPPRAVLRLGAAEDEIDGFLAGLDVPVLRDADDLRGAGFAPLRWAEALGGIDLAEPPGAGHDRLAARIGLWRLPVVAAALGVAIWLGAVFVETQGYQKDATRDVGLTQAMVREHFVPQGPLLDIRAQVAAAMARTGPAEFADPALPALTQLQIAAPVLMGETLQSAAWRADTGLVVTVAAGDFAALDRLDAELAEAGFAVDRLDSRAQQTGGVVARLRLEMTP